MNPAAMIIDELHRSGVRIRAIEGGQLGLAPRSRVTPDIIALIRRHKPELLALLERKRRSFAQVEARRLIRTCKEYGVGLRLEPDGTLGMTFNGGLSDHWSTPQRRRGRRRRLILARWDGSDA